MPVWLWTVGIAESAGGPAGEVWVTIRQGPSPGVMETTTERFELSQVRSALSSWFLADLDYGLEILMGEGALE